MSSTVNLLTMKVLHKYRSANLFVLYKKYNNINTRTMNPSNKMLWTTDLSHIIITQLHRASPFHLQEAQILVSSPGCGGSWGSLSHACLILWQDKGANGGWLNKTINHHLNWPIAVAHRSNINLMSSIKQNILKNQDTTKTVCNSALNYITLKTVLQQPILWRKHLKNSPSINIHLQSVAQVTHC